MYKNTWELAQAHVIALQPILKTIGNRGIRIDPDRLASFNQRLDEEMAALQLSFDNDPALVPFRGYHPKEGYKKVPKDTAGMVEAVFKVEPKPIEFGDPYSIGSDAPVFKRRWARLKPFLATSSQQVLAYAKGQGHRVKLVKDKVTGEQKETSDQKSLLVAWRRHNDTHYRDFVQMRKLRKMRGTYGNWRTVVRDDQVYAPTKYTLKPETNRLSSTDNNLQNIPKKGPLAKEFRKCLVASVGCVLNEADLGSAEAVIIGWLSGDPLLARLSKLGMHKYVMARKMGVRVDLGWTDHDLSLLFDELKAKEPELYNIIKTVVYGSFYLAGPKTLFEKNPEEFSSQAEVKEFQRFLFSTIPALRVWQSNVVQQKFKWTPTHRWGWIGNRLVNPFGFSAEYWDMYGGDGPAACAFLPQSTIGSLMKEAILQLWPMMAGRYMNLQIHDSLVFDCPVELADQIKGEVEGIMGQAWPQLGGLRIPVETKIGNSL